MTEDINFQAIIENNFKVISLSVSQDRNFEVPVDFLYSFISPYFYDLKIKQAWSDAQEIESSYERTIKKLRIIMCNLHAMKLIPPSYPLKDKYFSDLLLISSPSENIVGAIDLQKVLFNHIWLEQQAILNASDLIIKLLDVRSAYLSPYITVYHYWEYSKLTEQADTSYLAVMKRIKILSDVMDKAELMLKRAHHDEVG